ncbi:uncharacterized protein LOC109852236 [Pseudomyrmex gracilis]|uniref:uncharacterized protein LOC109852236 n=1 Tax=Pseudomyrmex gracilis TaxID=219809 RepID=UPI000995C8BF|nr:uncharacterized protein LOC109852236 [Pseudomyrmex gracilis]XP_020278797.1 uncharacterized protein LOC109852236 [Pseudomyrmex gracilis]
MRSTDECINAEILANINRLIDPSDNLYKFPCGGWLQNNQAHLLFSIIDFTLSALSYFRDKMIQLNNNQWQKESYTFDTASVANNLTEEIDGTVIMNKFIQNAIDILHFKMELANLTSIVKDLMDVDTFISLTIHQVQEEYDKQHPGMKGKINWHLTIREIFVSEGIAIELSKVAAARSERL